MKVSKRVKINSVSVLASIVILISAGLVVPGVCHAETASAGAISGTGYNYFGEANAPAGSDFTAVSCGYYHSMALKSDGTVISWGYNKDYGQCNVPPAGNTFKAIAAAEFFSLAIKTDGTLDAWGRNQHGQCNVPAGNDFMAITAGWGHCIAIKSDGSAVAWGNNEFGKCSIPAGNKFKAVAAGGYHSAAVKSDGSLAA